jgi:hypothetical protein
MTLLRQLISDPVSRVISEIIPPMVPEMTGDLLSFPFAKATNHMDFFSKEPFFF